MKGDFSKLRFDAKKHYHGVLMQQGRVILDSDWNEQGAIMAYRAETAMLDITGGNGAPLHNAGFLVSPFDATGNPVANGNNLKIFKGRIYVDGILCENDDDIVFAAQPDFAGTALPGVLSPPAAAATYMFYLDVWQRHISVLEDPSIREVALGGPDTTSRAKTTWQVKYADVSNIAGGANCLTGLPSDVLPLSTGSMSARPEQDVVATDPCGLTATGGYRRLENQLYRVEIHTAGATRSQAKFKWSRDNGSVAVKWTGIDTNDPNKLIAASAGRDELLGFKTGNWIELIDDNTELLGKPGVMVQLAQVDGNILTINPSTINDPNNGSATKVTIGASNPRIRRWDSDGIVSMNSANATWVKLEDGVEVKFSEGIYKTGDYWLIPARTATASVEWPKDSSNQPLAVPAHGIKHHYCKLALLDINAAGQWTLKSDCRPLFPPLTEMVNLYYAGGDGQEAMPGQMLPATLKVGVANGQWAITGAKIKFEILSGDGSLGQSVVPTNAQGIAETSWTIGSSTANLLLQVKASLLDAGGNVLPKQLPIIFNASFSIAQNVAYTPKCDNWTGTPPDTVADALDQLCERKSASGKGCSYTIGPGGDFKNLWEAIQVLYKKKEKDVSLCFLPGDHTIDEDILMLTKEMRFDILKISGYTANITTKVKRIDIAAGKLILQGINLLSNPADPGVTPSPAAMPVPSLTPAFIATAEPGAPAKATRGKKVLASKAPSKKAVKAATTMTPAGKTAADAANLKAAAVINDAQIRLIADEIIMDYCSLTRNGISALTFVLIYKAATVYISNNKIFALPSIELVNGVQGVLEKNVFITALLQSGNSGNFKQGLFSWPNQQTKKALMDGMQQKFTPTDWALTIKSNRVSLITTDMDPTKPNSLYQDMFVSDNIFAAAANGFAARYLTITNNQFVFEALQSVVQCFLIGFNDIVIGNSGAPAKVVTGATGLNSIDAIALYGIRGGGIGQAQILNLLDIVV